MKLKLPLLLSIAVSALAFPILNFAQVTGTYDDCKIEFTASLTDWPNVVDVTTDAICWTSNGVVTLSVYGKSDSSVLIADRLMEIQAVRGQRDKRCIITVRAVPGGYLSTWSRGLTGSDFSKWNRYLKGAGCLDVLALKPE